MNRRQFATVIALPLVALCMVALAAAVEKQTSEANITADKFKANVSTGVWEFTGNCRVEIKGPDKGFMTAPRVLGTFDRAGSQVTEIKAFGPVNFDMTTRKDAEGVQRRIVARCTDQAVYAGAARTITLTGNPEAAVSTIPSPPDAKPATFTGRKLIITLKDEITIEGEGVKFDVEFPPETQQEAPPAP